MTEISYTSAGMDLDDETESQAMDMLCRMARRFGKTHEHFFCGQLCRLLKPWNQGRELRRRYYAMRAVYRTTVHQCVRIPFA